ncbi:hypothetical protein I9W82_003030 [Candida metapsilosis]|uniref:R3H domain-containing protein n=1 Tax=Candida metapsilosis TaxID=273372 RepID=A0A8H7ZCE9_9ASCO|nr:hypothetical protein I9W82_003030 [Candida metapsilosis]
MTSDIPQSILTALTKYQDRPFILYLEKDLIKFIKNSILGNIKQPEYVIQAQYLKNSYYRLLSHQLCHYYHLQHWNNQSNEIVVTPSENFDYGLFLTKIEDDDEEESSDRFVKVADVAHKYQPVHTPEPQQQNGYIHSSSHQQKPLHHYGVVSHQHNNNFHHSHQQQQRQHHPSSDRIDSDKSTETSSASNAQPFKPKMIVKKIISKPAAASSPPASEPNGNSINGSIESLSKLKIDENASSSVPPSEGSEESLNTTSSTTMESQRASKEALYKKVRDEIFLSEDNDQTGEEEEEEEDDEEENKEGAEEGEVEYQEGSEDKEQNQTRDRNFTRDRNRLNYRRGREYNPHYHKNQHYSVPYQVPIHMQYPQMYHPHHNPGSPIIPQASTIPVLYNPYYPTVQPQLIPQPYSAAAAAAAAAPPGTPGTPGTPGSATSPVTAAAYAPSFQNLPVYDKETERRILNNPYIILPGDLDTNDRFKNNPKHNSQPHKTKRMYQNGNGSGASIGRTNNFKKP